MNYADEKYDVRFRHIRKSKKNGKKVGMICSVKDKENNEIGIGWSLCCKKDRYNAQVGADIAYGRAMKVLNGKMYDDIPDIVEKFIGEKHVRLSDNIVPITFFKLKIQDGIKDPMELNRFFSRPMGKRKHHFINLHEFLLTRPKINIGISS